MTGDGRESSTNRKMLFLDNSESFKTSANKVAIEASQAAASDRAEIFSVESLDEFIVPVFFLLIPNRPGRSIKNSGYERTQFNEQLASKQIGRFAALFGDCKPAATAILLMYWLLSYVRRV